jgi:hypothetical protein
MKAIIVGRVAGGASCAARLRRLVEKAEILMVERVPGALNIPLPQLRSRLGELPATVRFTSSAVPPSAPATQREFWRRTDLR